MGEHNGRGDVIHGVRTKGQDVAIAIRAECAVQSVRNSVLRSRIDTVISSVKESKSKSESQISGVHTVAVVLCPDLGRSLNVALTRIEEKMSDSVRGSERGRMVTVPTGGELSER